MKTLLNRAALLLGVTCLVWVAVLWQWQRTRRDMSVEDIVLYLGVLPLVVLLLIVSAAWAWRGVAAKRSALNGAATPAAAAGAGAAAVGNAAGAGSPGAATPAGATDESLRHAVWPVWLAALQTPAGASPADVLVAAKDGKPRPEPCAMLLAQDGLPVMAACIPDLATDDAPDGLLARVDRTVRDRRTAQGQASPGALDAAVVRVLAAMEPVIAQAVQALLPWAATLQAPAARPCIVQVLLGLPDTWHGHERDVAEDWVRLQLTAPHAAAIPAARWSIRTHPAGGEELLMEADRILAQQALQDMPGLVLLLAAHSQISESAVEALEAQGRLFHAGQRPKGHMPSEAAAALLLGCPPQPVDTGDEDSPSASPLCVVHRPARARRDKSVEAPGRIGASELTALAGHALAVARTEPAAIAAVVNDGDQHTARGTELFATTLELLPDLDIVEDLRQLGTVCGGAGAATPLLVLAAACAHAQALDRPVLALCQGDPIARLAVVARPLPPPDAAKPGAAPGAALVS